MTEVTCLSCGKRFTPWRGKKYCSEKCAARARKRAERAKIPDGQNGEKIPQLNQYDPNQMSRDETPRDIVRAAEWVACNEITDKFQYKDRAIGWTMNIQGKGWYGRVGKEMSFGPTTRYRAKSAVEAYLRGEPFDKLEDEISWRGTCWKLVSGADSWPHGV